MANLPNGCIVSIVMGLVEHPLGHEIRGNSMRFVWRLRLFHKSQGGAFDTLKFGEIQWIFSGILIIFNWEFFPF